MSIHRLIIPHPSLSLLAISVGMLLPGALVEAAPQADEVIVQNLSRNEAVSLWDVENGTLRISKSSLKTPPPGGSAVRFDYVTQGWQVAQLVPTKHRVGDWRGGDALEWDILFEGPDEKLAFFRVDLIGQEKRPFFSSAYQEEIPVGQWIRFSIPLRREPGMPELYPGLNRASIRDVQFRFWPSRPPNYPEKKIAAHVANLRVTSTAEQRYSLAGQRLERLLRSGVLEEGERAEAQKLLSDLKSLKAATSSDRKAREEFSKKVLLIEDALKILSFKGVERALTKLDQEAFLQLVIDLGYAGSTSPKEWRLLSNEGGDQGEARARAVEFAKGLQERRELDLRLQEESLKFYGDAGFAIGIPSWPLAWTDEKYSGSIGRTITLKAARNEYEPFQLVVLANRQALQNVRFEVSDLTGEAGTIPASSIEVAPQGWRKLQGKAGWIADMLRTDIQSFDVEKGRFQPVWVNVHIPMESAPGSYTGTVTIHADGVNPEAVTLTVEVWPFALPTSPSMPTAANYTPADTNLAAAKAIIDRRWNPFQMYRWDNSVKPETLEAWTEMGATLHNLLQISRFSAKYEKGPDGKPQVRNKEVFYRKLDPVVREIRENHPDLWKHVLLYGFDEPSAEQAVAMEEFYGDLKQRYHGIQTMFADLYGMWDLLPELPKNVDHWAVSREILTPEVRDRLQGAGIKVWWYNAYANPEDPVGARVQYWSSFKDKLDGIVFYNLDAGGGGSRHRGKNPWTNSLWPDTERMDGGMMRIGPNGEAIPSVTFENWREGMEDLEYLYLLKERRNLLEKQAGEKLTEAQKLLIQQADRMLQIPDSITTGLLGSRGKDMDEVVVELSGHTREMGDILAARAEISRLIVAIDHELTAKH